MNRRSAAAWFSEYDVSHRHPLNKAIHWVCVPGIYWSIMAMLWWLPQPGWLQALPLLNWAVLSLVITLPFYLSLGGRYAAGMLLFTLACFALSALLADWLPWLATGVFVIAWAGQFYGHHVEGRKPSFFKDLQFLLVGPAWLLDALYRR